MKVVSNLCTIKVKSIKIIAENIIYALKAIKIEGVNIYICIIIGVVGSIPNGAQIIDVI